MTTKNAGMPINATRATWLCFQRYFSQGVCVKVVEPILCEREHNNAKERRSVSKQSHVDGT